MFILIVYTVQTKFICIVIKITRIEKNLMLWLKIIDEPNKVRTNQILYRIK